MSENYDQDKEVIGFPQLWEKLQTIVDNCPECNDVRVKVVRQQHKKIDGSNWNIDAVQLTGNSFDLMQCEAGIAVDIRLLRNTYDVAPSRRITPIAAIFTPTATISTDRREMVRFEDRRE